MSDAPTSTELEEKLRKADLELALVKECLAQFTHGISHEINSPAKTLKNLLELLDEEYRQHFDAEGIELLDMITLSSNRLCDTIGGVLAFSGCSRPPKFKEAVDCNSLVNEIMTELAPVIDRNKACIVVEQLPIINSSKKSLLQLFYHLIDNALKFTNTDSEPAVINISAQRVEKGYAFIVSDQGKGISPERRESIFNVFERLNSQAQHRGAGIGLALCRQIVTALGGKLWMEPAEHHGAAFHVYLPD